MQCVAFCLKMSQMHNTRHFVGNQLRSQKLIWSANVFVHTYLNYWIVAGETKIHLLVNVFFKVSIIKIELINGTIYMAWQINNIQARHPLLINEQSYKQSHNWQTSLIQRVIYFSLSKQPNKLSVKSSKCQVPNRFELVEWVFQIYTIHLQWSVEVACSADEERRVVNEFVLGYLEVERCRSLADPSGCVVVWAVTGAVVATIVTLIGDWNAP